ncbi:MAG: hypothetical protein KJ630_15480 [Proteobacteria bacterium]|nr:hypothetical protein [Pseudomonadota bacterium]
MSTVTFLIDFVERWLGAFPRVVLAFMGALLCVVVIGMFWDRRLRFFAAVVGFLVGISMVFHTAILGSFSAMTFDQRVRVIGVVFGVAILAVTIQAVRVSSLYKRYAFFWFALAAALLLGCLRLESIRSFAASLELHVLALIGGVILGLLSLLLFHFSVVLTRLEKQCLSLRERLQHEGMGADVEAADIQRASYSPKRLLCLCGQLVQTLRALFSADSMGRAVRGTRVGAPLAILLASLAVLLVGLATPQAMVGDEVTHYYMLVKQAQNVSQPNFYADIPMASGGVETRRYPHSNGWHYLGALVYLVTGGSFAGVQVYQAFFLLQLLTVAYLLARSRGGVESRSALLYVLTLASLPLGLFFSVAFYQDVPMTAQVLTSFYLLNKRHCFWASCFMALAICFKVTAALFFPAFFFLVFLWEVKKSGWRQGALAFLCSTLIVLGSTWILGKTINIYAQSAFYPQEKLEIVATVVKNRIQALLSNTKPVPVARIVEKSSADSAQFNRGNSPETAPTIIANHPGDLRIKENYLIYGGLMIWFLIGLSLMSGLPIIRKKLSSSGKGEDWWLFGIGGSFLLLTAYLVRTAPDARFFLPGLPFILLPLAERVVHLPKPKLLITVAAALALLQGGYVLNKAYHLRVVPPGIVAGIEYLKLHPTEPRTIFMYPEGNYRLFPVPHEWYMGYRLRDFWRGDNDKRLAMLRQHGIGAIVVKKHLIAPVDEQITNLGVYPPQFVMDLRTDERFVKSFENDDLAIFLPPAQAKIE